jgi:cardiolipin synthase
MPAPKIRRLHPLTLLSCGAAAGAIGTLLARNFIPNEKKISHEIDLDYGVDDPRFERSLGQLLGPAILNGNRVRDLQNGDEIFPAMLAAISGARHSVTLESFIYWEGEIALKFSAALSDRAQAGVKVHVLLDGLGCNCIRSELVRRMKDAGVQVEIYNVIEPYDIDRFNNRTHRKLLVVDGRIGFTGGVGIADNWLGRGDSLHHWRDSHYQVEGPVVAQMQSAFVDNWMKTRATVLHGNAYFPDLPAVGTQRCQMFKSAPHEGSDSARLMFLFSIAAARRSICLANAYFIPDDLTLRTLVEASERGVRVEILVPGPHIDKLWVRAASRTRWGALLKAGARFFEFQPTMLHCKLLIVDGTWVSVGSANFDNRSFRLNDEANLNVLDAGFGRQQMYVFAADKRRSREITYAEWQSRSPVQKFLDGTSALLRSQM